MAENRTQASDADVAAFLAGVDLARRREDGLRLDALFRRATGWRPAMWGPSIVGYGRYHYRYDSGREGEFLATGFSPRKASLVVYVMPGYGDFGDILDRLGKHRLGKSCLYINKMADIDAAVLEELIRAGLSDLATRRDVRPG